jgi:hypothetical protein
MGHGGIGMGRSSHGGMGTIGMGGRQMSIGMPGGYRSFQGRRAGRDASVGGVWAEEERLVSREWMAVLGNRPAERVPERVPEARRRRIVKG